MTWLIATVIIVGGVGVLWWWRQKPVLYRGIEAAELDRFIWSLGVQMTPGSFMFADREGADGFIQVSLRYASRERAEIEFGIPKVHWSESAFADIEDATTQMGLATLRENGYGAVGAFLHVRLSGSHEELRTMGGEVVVMRIRTLEWSNPLFTVHFEGGLRPLKEHGV
jgi:hypothetical protein